MPNSERVKIIAGNWKMNKTIQEAIDFIHQLTPLIRDAEAKVFLAVPYTAIHACSEAANDTSIVIGAQNMHEAEEGAFTGEISAKMIKEAGATFVILGHSERRQFFHETNALINKKIKLAIKHHLSPILCIGETLDEREKSMTEQVLAVQLRECLEGIQESEAASLIIAYEPIWAIGTGKTATPEMAQATHAFCRHFLKERFGEKISSQMILQYGGSVKPESAAALLTQKDIDGALVGGASLNADTFARIVNDH